MNDVIQSILTGIFIAGAIIWVVRKLIRHDTKGGNECKDCPLADKCNKNCHRHSGCNCQN